MCLHNLANKIRCNEDSGEFDNTALELLVCVEQTALCAETYCEFI